jgi:hypothetical protein
MSKTICSHMSKNTDDGLAGYDLGQGEDCSYFLGGEPWTAERACFVVWCIL